MRQGITLAFLVAGCTSSPTQNQLPTATFTPHLDEPSSSVACGDDIAFYSNTTPDLRYAFAYDSGGHIAQANGAWLADGSTETTVYTWNGDNLTHMLSTSSWDGSQSEVTATYGANGLLDYAWSYTGPHYEDAWSYAFSSFNAPDQPGHEVITENGQAVVAYDLVYDASNRLVQAIPDTGPSTSWTYDDAALTITADTGNGAFVDVMTYGADYRPLTASWTGTDPSAIDGDESYAWNGDQLASYTYRSGSEAAPHQVEIVQVDTLRYDCSTARRAPSHIKPFKSPLPRRY